MAYNSGNELNFKEVCRVCTKNADTFLSISLFKIIKMLTTCTSVQVEENDELPKQICNTCYTQLENAFNFKQLCEDSDSIFRQTLQNYFENKLSTEIIIDTKLENEIEYLNNSDSEQYYNEKEFDVDITNENDDTIDEINEENSEQYYNVKKLEIDLIEGKRNEDNMYFDSHFMDVDSVPKRKKHEYEENFPNHIIKNLVSEQNITQKEIYVCELCNSKFDKVWYLGYHMRRSHGSVGVRCSTCAFVCYHPLHLIMHEKSHYTTVYKFECDVCKKLFKIASDLSRHRVLHTNKRPFACDKCDNTFKDKKGLNSHMQKKHSDKSSSPCSICGKHFFDYTLNLHMKRQHGSHFLTTGSNNKPFECCHCNKSFSNKSGLKKHFKTHSN